MSNQHHPRTMKFQKFAWFFENHILCSSLSDTLILETPHYKLKIKKKCLGECYNNLRF